VEFRSHRRHDRKSLARHARRLTGKRPMDALPSRLATTGGHRQSVLLAQPSSISYELRWRNNASATIACRSTAVVAVSPGDSDRSIRMSRSRRTR
jgi:hypothetical protein